MKPIQKHTLLLPIAALFALIILINNSCKNLGEYKNTTKGFKIVQKTIPIIGELEIKNCVKWFIDFKYLKRTIIYRDKIICMGSNGGFCCLNSSNFEIDSILSNKMNTDFYSNICVYQDTLFTEKFDSLYFWDETQWQKYNHPLPIKYFDLLLDDKNYTFYTSDGGEFGSILFVYNKRTKITKAKYTTEPNSCFKLDSGYFIGTHLYHMAAYSYEYVIRDIEKLKIINDTLRYADGMFDRDPRFYSIIDTSTVAKKNIIPFEYKFSEIKPEYKDDNVVIIGSFVHNGSIFHVVDPLLSRRLNYIASIKNDSLKIIDSLPYSNSNLIYQFGRSSVINQAKGFSLIRNDTIFQVQFNVSHPSYKGPGFESFSINTDSSKKTDEYVESKWNSNEGNDWRELRPNEPDNEIKFTFKEKYRIEGFYGYGFNKTHIYQGNSKSTLEFKNWISEILTYDGRLFLLFSNLKLVEITDMNQFIKQYKKQTRL